MSRLALPAALLCLALWVLLTFVVPAGLGIVHLLLAAGVLLVMRWWVVRDARAAG